MRGPTVDSAAPGPQASEQQGTGLTSPKPSASDRLPGWLVAVVPALAELVVGGYRISGPSLWRDEAATISGSRRPLSAIMALTLHQDAVHGAYYLLMHAVIAVGGISETALRLPSLIAMSLAAGLTALLGRRLAEGSALPAPKITGLVAGLLLVVVPLTTRYAQEARPYALTTLFAVLGTYLLVRAAASERRGWWAGYAAAITLTGLVNLFAVLIVAAHGASLLAARPTASGERPAGVSLTAGTIRRWLLASAVAGVLLAPIAVLSVRQSAQLSWVTRPDPSTVATLIRDFSGITVLILVMAGLLVLGCLAGPGLARSGGLTLALVALPWLVVPPVLLLAVSLAHPVYVERYVVFCLPALSLLVAAGLGRLTSQRLLGRGATVLPSAALAVIIVGALIGPQLAIRLPTARADNLRAVAAALAAHERPGDAILYLPWDTAVITNAYPAPYAKLRDVGIGQTPVASATLRGLPAGPNVVAARLHGVSRAWTVQWIPPVPSAGPVRTGLVTGSGLRLIARWRIASVLLSLYARG